MQWISIFLCKTPKPDTVPPCCLFIMSFSVSRQKSTSQMNCNDDWWKYGALSNSLFFDAATYDLRKILRACVSALSTHLDYSLWYVYTALSYSKQRQRTDKPFLRHFCLLNSLQNGERANFAHWLGVQWLKSSQFQGQAPWFPDQGLQWAHALGPVIGSRSLLAM